MSDNQSNLTDKEMEDLKNIVTDTLANVCARADKHNIGRDSMLKYFADILLTVQAIQQVPFCFHILLACLYPYNVLPVLFRLKSNHQQRVCTYDLLSKTDTH